MNKTTPADGEDRPFKVERAKKNLSWIALFLGELRDGLTMINMQSAFLITSRHYTEKQAGIMFFVFGMSQFLFQTPAGYLMDYSENKVQLLGLSSIATTLFTLLTAAFAQDYGANIVFMVIVKFFQGAVTALIPPGLNSITQGIVGSTGMTNQVSRNEMMNHLGTFIIVLTGSLLAFMLYPDIGLLFIVSPIACIGVVYFLSRIRPGDIDHNAARGLEGAAESRTLSTLESFDETSGRRYNPPTIAKSASMDNQTVQVAPSFNFGLGAESQNISDNQNSTPKADTPWKVLRDPILLIFIAVCFLFHLSNGTVLPLVMQTLAIENGRTGILMSGMCIIVAQICMVVSAKICGDYSGIYGRKGIFLIGLFSVSIRCAILTFLLHLKQMNGDNDDGQESSGFLDLLILSTQILDGIGAGVFGTMYVLVTSDLSGGTGRFSFILGLTTSAMQMGGTVSGYLGQAIAQDMGYRQAFIILGALSLLPALLYLFIMPETLSLRNGSTGNQMMDGIIEEEDDNETEYRVA